MMLDQHMLVVIITLSTQAQAPTGVHVHRLERFGVGFARPVAFATPTRSLLSSRSRVFLSNVCWAVAILRQANGHPAAIAAQHNW